MEVHSDLAQRAVVDSHALNWLGDPQTGITYKVLECDGEALQRTTTLVRLAPGSAFPTHGHPLGEEVYVLEGTWLDGEPHPAGSYLRYPAGYEHAPSSPEGCLLLVKTGQMLAPPDSRVVVQGGGLPWEPRPLPLAEGRSLFHHPPTGETVYLVRFAPGFRSQHDPHPAGEEVLVLEGEVHDEHGVYPAGTWFRWPAGSQHAPHSPAGATLWVKKGHVVP